MIDYTSLIGGNQSIPKSPRLEKKNVANVDPEDLAEVSRLALTEGVMKHPIIRPSTAYPADYYRRGGPYRPRTDIQEGEPVSYYQDPAPRWLADAEEEEVASIRMLGRPNRNPKARVMDLIPPYSKFFLEGVQEGHSERSQIIETFGDFFVFFFGERPPVYTFSGMLLNADNINWAEDFFFYYDNFLRGTKCVEAGAVLTITYGFRQIEGFLLGINMSVNAVSERGIPVNFQILVTDRKYLKLSPDFGVIETGDNRFITDPSLLEMLRTGTSDGVASEGYVTSKSVLLKEAPASSSKRLTSKDVALKGNQYNNQLAKAGKKIGTSTKGNGGLSIINR